MKLPRDSADHSSILWRIAAIEAAEPPRQEQRDQKSAGAEYGGDATLNIAARDLDALRIDPAILLREQRGNHLTDVVGNTRSAQRSPFGHPFVYDRIVADDTECTDVAGIELQGDGRLPGLSRQADDFFGFELLG